MEPEQMRALLGLLADLYIEVGRGALQNSALQEALKEAQDSKSPDSSK